jgi:GMP synthase-like glutamine amidotransferase
MRPVAIFRHSPTEGPGYFAIALERRGLPWRLVRIDAGEPIPSDPRQFSGIAFMGGPMSVNDPLGWIAPVLQLIRAAVREDVPVIGHCLGGQLMALALGGQVTRSPIKEIGWGEVTIADSDEARAWFGSDVRAFASFHWHGETFSVPSGGKLLLSSPYCSNQAFTLGKHLGMQCHIEMTAELIESWCRSGAQEIADSAGPAVQSPDAMQEALDSRLAPLHAIADRVYERWLEGLAR